MAKSNTICCDSDAKWRAECDARTLAEAQQIMLDKKRVGAATKAANKMAKEKQKEAAAMSKVASKSKTPVRRGKK